MPSTCSWGSVIYWHFFIFDIYQVSKPAIICKSLQELDWGLTHCMRNNAFSRLIKSRWFVEVVVLQNTMLEDLFCLLAGVLWYSFLHCLNFLPAFSWNFWLKPQQIYIQVIFALDLCVTLTNIFYLNMFLLSDIYALLSII